MSDSDRMQLAYVEESTFGEIVTGSNLKKLRWTGESLHQETSTTESNEIRSDRQVSDVVRTNIRASGDINIEMSYGAHDDLLQAAMLSSGWSTPVTVGPATTISAANSDNSFNDSANGFTNLVAGQWVKVSGFTETANNGIFKIVSKTNAKIVVSGGTLTDESAGDSVIVVMGAQITNGLTLKSFNLEKCYSDLSSEYAVLTGMCVNQFSMSIASESMITGGFSFLGKKEQSATSSSGTGYDDAPTNSVMNVVDDIEGVLENQASFDSTSLSFQLQNNLRDRSKIGELGAISIAKGKVGLTGTLQAYFESKAILDKYLNFTASSLAVVVQDGSGNAYVFDMPKVKYTSGQRVAGGQNSDIIADMAFTAYRHPTEDITLRIARFPAA